MAWTAYPTWVVGQVSTASDWNTYVANNVSFLATPPMFRVYRNASLTLTSGVNTKLVFDTVNFDSQTGYGTVSGEYNIEVAGTYYFYTQISSSVPTAGHGGIAKFYYNPQSAGASVWSQGSWDATNAATDDNWAAVNNDLIGPCLVGDQVDVRYLAVDADGCNTGTNLTYFGGFKVSN